MKNHHNLIKQQYTNSKGDSTELFQTILMVAQEIGLDQSLNYLEKCVSENKKAYHRPVQAFLSFLNPKLRFDRNYEALRPYQAYCEEIIALEE
jgi:hypothetical protein